MARDSDSYGDGTRPFDATFGDATSGGPLERDATGFLGDDNVRLDLFSAAGADSTAYLTPAGDPFDDSLAEPTWSDSALSGTPDRATVEQPDEDPTRDGQQPPTGQIPAQQQAPVQPRPPAAAQQPRPPAPARPPAPPVRRNDPSRGAPPPPANRRVPPGSQPARQSSQPTRQPAPGQPAPGQSPSRQPAPRPSPSRQPAARQPAPSRPAPATRQPAKSPYPLALDDLTKRPPISRQQAPRRPKAGPQRTNSMARFPSGTGERAAPPPAQSAPARRARNVRPIVPIVLFVVILIGLIRGCANARDKGEGPRPGVVYSLTR
jgi:hypothetical protein